ncbi:uncharacterized protein E0L32_008490 [Thyridium curvatum]|uniref:HECT-type E3 ubiquitin transferase n=1 Tax=Thyridium curvatum TaxID=1093900 RepID=A0A507AVU7_9PEZI|nr:uncharacterized protein E0L32_008490 [Thyridium curvatum]TPX10604.1 hypothetical protein E0L32_008490 [Thyridium curvatum]
MGKISKTMQNKHKETLSPWLKDFVQTVSAAPLPLIPQHLDRFPTRWPFPRGDLYHWIPLLNRFDNILEGVAATYKLGDGPQARDFGCDILLKKCPSINFQDDQPWDMARLKELGYEKDGDSQLLISILKFSRMLLERCGNRSIYASSAHLNELLNSTSLPVLLATLQVGMQLAQRYQASVKRMGGTNRQISNAILANHYDIELDRVHQLAQPFVKTPIVPLATDPTTPKTPASTGKGKEKAHGAAAKNVASLYANDLVSIATPDQQDEGRWHGWGDLKLVYYPQQNPADPSSSRAPALDRGSSSVPTTPTPLRRSNTAGSTQHRTPRNERAGASGVEDGSSPVSYTRSPAMAHDDSAAPSQKLFEIPQTAVSSSSIYDLLSRCPADMPEGYRYEVLNRLRIAKALLDSPESRQQALAVRFMAILNLAYIHPEAIFVEKALRQDNDEPRRFQLTYQLTEFIHPSTVGAPAMPLWLQSIALRLLEAICMMQSKLSDVLSALNANVNHGVLLYVIRKAVAEMKEDEDDTGDQVTVTDEWRGNLFSLAMFVTMSGRIGNEVISAGLMDVLIDILKIRSPTAVRVHSVVLTFLDNLIYGIQGAFQAFVNGRGLDCISQLLIDTTSSAIELTNSGSGTKPEFRSTIVDYEIPFYQQQVLKWLLKLTHHIMSNAYTYGGNTDRLLRNLVDNSTMLDSLRRIMESMKRFGSVVWTNVVTILSDFINNDPTSFAAISESGMITSFLESITGRPVVSEQVDAQSSHATATDEEADDASSPESDGSVLLETDHRPHPPTNDTLEATRDRPLARGILPSSEAISIIPTILNSISLNNAGMKMVVSSRAFDSYLDIFESPLHVHCMEGDIDLASSVGNSFDELARHHPALRPAIANSVLDMVARVNYLAKSKAENEGWGVKMLGDASPQQDVTTAESTKGKQTATLPEDVTMQDAVESTEGKSSAISEGTDSASTVPSHTEITPYINALSTFLSAYLTNTNLRSLFVRDGGVELLLDLSATPSLPYDFAETAAARTLQHVVSQVAEQSPILCLPSLLQRTQSAIDALGPMITAGESHSIFRKFLAFGPEAPTVQDEDLEQGTKVVKALLSAEILIRTLYQCFPYSSRHATHTLHSVNVFDYYTHLIKSLAPLLRPILTAELDIAGSVPSHWTRPVSVAQDKPSDQNAAGSATPGDEGDDITIQDILTAEARQENTAGQLTKLSPQEQASNRYRNFKTLRTLLHAFMPTALPFYQTLGKALLPRRERDPYLRSGHLRIAEALAETILYQLDSGQLDKADYHYWIVMLHTVHEMFVDHTRPSDRSGAHIIIPVLVAFKKRGGLDSLNALLRSFISEVSRGPDEAAQVSAKPRMAVLGMKKILELYALLVNGKNISESVSQVDRNSSHGGAQLLVELRMAILPIARELWDSDIMEKISTPVLSKIVEILKTIASGSDLESNAYRRAEGKPPPPPLFNTEVVKFRWSLASNQISTLAQRQNAQHQNYGEDLAREAVYRANGNLDGATEYCRAHSAGLAGPRHPVPEDDAYQVPPTPEQTGLQSQPSAPSAAALLSDAMMLDPSPELDRLLGEAGLDDLREHSSDVSSSNDDDEAVDPPATSSANTGQDNQPATSTAKAPSSLSRSTSGTTLPVSKEDLDAEREKLKANLIDRCLEIIAAHPDAVHDVSELISTIVLKSDNDDDRQEVGETLANALMSLSISDEVEKPNAQRIAAYAHLLSILLLESTALFQSTLPTIRDNLAAYLSFLHIPPSSATEELPQWTPYILLIFEILLSDDCQVVEAKWKPPTSESDTIEPLVLQAKEPVIGDEERQVLLDAVLELLPRIGKEEMLATAILRVLVVMTRSRSTAKIVGEKKNLQRLFVMAKQLSGVGSMRFKEGRIGANIMIILRHIVEDDETIKQIMRSEIQAYFEGPSRTQRAHEIQNFLRNMSHVALRSPELFVEATQEMTKLHKWLPSQSDRSAPQGSLQLKEKSEQSSPEDNRKDDSVGPAVQATQGLNINDVKPSTEGQDQEMADAPKTPAHDHKRPIVENPDGIINFLLEQLLNYQRVDDAEVAQKDPKPVEAATSSVSPGSSSAADSPTGADSKEKKSPKVPFKPEDHPIFVYRCFLLNCLAELLQSYNRAKMEFINFKRGAPLLMHTPVKPRSSVLNYLLNDLLCVGTLPSSMDTTAAKKKTATSDQARQVLVALVSKTNEKFGDQTKDRYEYDEEPDLLFVRKFVLDTILRAYKEASTPIEAFDVRYAKMLSLGELMAHMIGEKDKDSATHRLPHNPSTRSQMQLRRLMYEKGYLAALTASIADIDLSYPGVKRTIKYILRVLRILTETAIQLSHSNILPLAPNEGVEDEIASASSLSDIDDDREETPDLYRNSALGMLEPREEDDFSDEDEDDEMYDDGYDEGLDYDEEITEDGEEDISDEDEEEMGDIEGLPGEPGVVEVIMDEDEDDESMDDDDDDEDLSDDDDDDDDEEIASEDMEDVENQIEIAGEGNGLGDGGSSGWESEHSVEDDELDYEGEGQDLDEMHMHDIEPEQLGRFADIARAMQAVDDMDPEDMGTFEDHYIDDGADDDDDEDDDLDGEEYIYEQEYPHDEPPPPVNLGWDNMFVEHAHNHRAHRHGGLRSPFPGGHSVVFGGPRHPLDDFRGVPRSGRSGAAPNNPDDGTNPLLRRTNNGRDSSMRPGNSGASVRLGVPGNFLGGGFMDSPLAFINDIVASLPNWPRSGQALHFQITQGPGGEVRELSIPFNPLQPGRESRSEGRRDTYLDPHHAVAFLTETTLDRWQEEAKIIFGFNHVDKAPKLFTSWILAKLTPAAIERSRAEKARKEEIERKAAEERKRIEEEKRKEREAKEAEEKAAREKQEAEERERAEREAAEAAAQAESIAEAQPAAGENESTSQAMEGVESTTRPEPEADVPRVMTTIRGEEVDITGLGIDPEYLAALPEEFREEVIAQTLTARRSEAREQAETSGEQTENFNEFLDALPQDLRDEIVQQERQEQRRRQREQERRNAAGGQAALPQDMDPASILLTFPTELRQQVLMEQGEDIIDQLPPDMRAEVRAMNARHHPTPSAPRVRSGAQEAVPTSDNKIQRRTVVQMLDKAGVATLLRLMFISQQGSIRNYLFSVFADICENRQNRLEVVSSLLQILQDGSTDMTAVERSFGQLSIKAKQPKDKDQKTPGGLKRSFTNISSSNHVPTNSDISPLLIVQQCLDLLSELSTRNLHVPSLFLTEHEPTTSSFKRALNKKEKGKGKDSKANRYAINSLLSLLDRDLIMESSSVMQLLADLLNKVTYPLQALERRRKEAQEEAMKEAEKKKKKETEAAASAQEASAEGSNEANVQSHQAEMQDGGSAGTEPGQSSTQTDAPTSEKQTAKAAEEKKVHQLQPPVIPVENLTLVINIFVARECSSKTFQNTISTIKNLSNIPGAKSVFGEELVRQARLLSENIVNDLIDLLPHIEKAETGTEIQGVALAKFSPGASEQNKLLRVLTALDHLFDTKGKKSDEPVDTEGPQKEEFLMSLYHNPTFNTMWEKLSACLSAIRQRESMLNVATILLPLIESLMVVCKNTTLSDSPPSQSQKEMLLSSPPPEDRIAGLFFAFTGEHRRILNELVRNNPKLMSGTFSLLVKNPKVLEFDNKRNYFNRSVHAKTGNQARPPFPTLQLSVRRDQVFHDSFRSLYFKTGDEMKFGKLNIRFHGEEGIDAGGVTREWFQVLARQMFDPNNALFIPVSSDRTTFHPNKLSYVNDDHLMFFKFIGRIIGKALYEGRLLDCYFSRAVYKRILGKPVSVKDMESFDPDYYKSLVWILENDITDILTETFSVEDDEFGVTNIIDLCENGRDIPVTDKNKKEYVRLVVEHKLISSVKEQMEHFLKGFHDIIPADLIAIFNEQELELLISGLPDIDIDDWKGNTEYHNYTAASQQIQWFWRALRSFDKEERAKLLQFVTGTSKVPLNGFKELEGMNGINRFNIHRDYGNKDRLPSSHTCFNQLDLPEYESYDALRSQLLKAITAGSEYFGFA